MLFVGASRGRQMCERQHAEADSHGEAPKQATSMETMAIATLPSGRSGSSLSSLHSFATDWRPNIEIGAARLATRAASYLTGGCRMAPPPPSLCCHRSSDLLLVATSLANCCAESRLRRRPVLAFVASRVAVAARSAAR